MNIMHLPPSGGYKHVVQALDSLDGFFLKKKTGQADKMAMTSCGDNILVNPSWLGTSKDAMPIDRKFAG